PLRPHAFPTRRSSDLNPLRPGEQVADQRPRLEEPMLVRMILDADQVEPELVRARRDCSDPVDICRVRDDAAPELESETVVGHRPDRKSTRLNSSHLAI